MHAIELPAGEEHLRVRKAYVRLCEGSLCEAMLLDVFERWLDTKLSSRHLSASEAQLRREALREGRFAEADVWVYRTQEELREEDLFGVFSERTVRRALTALQGRNLLVRRQRPSADRTAQYVLDVRRIEHAVGVEVVIEEAVDDESATANRSNWPVGDPGEAVKLAGSLGPSGQGDRMERPAVPVGAASGAGCIDGFSESVSRVREDDHSPTDSRINKSGLPRALHGLALESLGGDKPYREAVALAGRWASGEVEGVYLAGAPSRGKSTIAAAALWRRLLESNARWASGDELAAAIPGPFGEERDVAMDVLGGKGALVLDDVTSIGGHSQVQRAVAGAVGRRINVGAPLLVTGEIALDDFDQLAELLGERLASRLVDYCEGAELSGPNLRRRAAPLRSAA